MAVVTLVGLVLTLAACSGGDENGAPGVAGPSAADSAETAVAVISDPVTAPSTTLAPSTSTTVATIPPTTAATIPPSGEYQPATAPAFPARSSPPPTGDGLPDGSYYAVADGAAADAAPRLRVTIYELLTGPDAIAAALADGTGLDSDVYVRPQPAAARDIELTPGLALSVARPDQPGVSYAVSPGELARLVSGGGPNADAPDGYRYLPFPYLITVQAGAPTRVEQLWAP
jgi:hypothetical protein